ncbi:uncharacterized protein LOC129984477 isoform X2 [Argiope bruennichi]|uniref:uncharacterized protein LOC129984477 isoform X2 n=1 Tax=Argiope bruennichi TaxID=94029 RepID=UPI00249431B8|nr:uncharacterized protein LOC129984477 isoform X2 [Argiope bruennichi]
MNPETPGTSKNSGPNEATPLLQDEAREMDDELYAIGGASGHTEEIICEPQTDVSDIVKTLFLAWLQFPPKWLDNPEYEGIEVLNPKSIQAMSTAWRKINAERNVLPKQEIILQGLVASMVEYMHRQQMMAMEGEENIVKEIFTGHIADIVAEGWQQILDGIDKEEARERAKKRRERLRRIRERRRRRKEIEEILSFYEPFARMDNRVPLTCRIFCIFLCQCCSIFTFQFPIHTMLLAWPLSIGIMGGIYFAECPMSHLMPYMMMAMGAVGTIALLARLSFVTYEKCSKEEINAVWPWTVLKVMEFAFLDLLIIQLYYFFSNTPSFDSGSPKYCNETFYTFVRWINYVSMALVSAWMFVYFVKGLLWWRGRIRSEPPANLI